MADLVLGLAKSTVEGTLSMVKSAIQEEKNLKKSVKRDLMLISDEFEMMHSFLNIAKDHTTDDMVRTLVRQVRNMALDVEDCIESVVHLDNKSTWWRSKLPSRMPAAAPAVALNEAVASIERLKARVEAMGQRNMRYSHISVPSSKPVVQMHQAIVVNATAFDILLKVRRNTRLQRGPLDLVKLINKKDGFLELEVISVWGTASSFGMTSIIKKAYYDPEICKNYRCRAWVKLMQPFNPHEFIRSLLIKFYTNYCPQQVQQVVMEVMESTKGELINRFTKELSNQSYLIVLESVSTMADWDIIRAYLPDNSNGSCVIVATQQLEIASLCIGGSYQVSELQQFSEDHSVCVLFKEMEKDKYTTKAVASDEWLRKFHWVAGNTDISIKNLAAQVEDGTNVISVWGVAGVGKLFVVRCAYYRAIQREKMNKFGWVNVSHPFNLVDLSRNLLWDLQSESPGCSSMLRIEDPIKECREFLHNHDKCLIVIDGLRSKEEWDLTKAALTFESSRNCVIIVITNEESIATYCSAHSRSVFNVKGLETGGAALELFRNKVREKTECPSLDRETIKQVKFILQKCGGIPRVIVAIADTFSSDIKNLLVSSGWRNLCDGFMQELETNRAFSNLQGLFAWVHSYFHTCPDFLKPCIFYLLIFPADHDIRRKRLVRRWIAEGYSRDTKDSTAEENGEQFFSMLAKLSMVQVPDEPIITAFSLRTPSCRVNGFFREYIVSRSMEENLVFALEGWCSINSQRTGRHLTIQRSWDRDPNVFESIDFSRLRSLTIFGRWEPFFISEKLRLLRVLDLEDAEGVTDGSVDQIVKLLPRLKFLSLRGCSDVSRLPDSLGGLLHLQTLDVRNTKIAVLPSTIIKLRKLQYVRAGSKIIPSSSDAASSYPAASVYPSTSLPAETQPTGQETHQDPSTPPMSSRPSTSVCCVSTFFRLRPVDARNSCGVRVPKGVGGLVALHTLGVVDASVAGGTAILAELKKLSQLHKLGVCGIDKNNSKELCDFVSDHHHLESLSLWLNQDDQGCLDGIKTVPPNLRSLKLCGPACSLPAWITKHQLQNLRKLSLQMTTLPQEGVDAIAEVPGLQFLHLCFEEYQDGELNFGKVLAALRVLKITCDDKLEIVRFHQKVLPNLDVLKIHCRRVSELKLSGLKNLRGVLKKVTLTGSCTYGWRVLLSRELFIGLEIFGFPLDHKNCSYWGPGPDYGSDYEDWPQIESHEIDEGPGSLTSVW